MTIVGLGKITVTTSGTPVVVVSSKLQVHRVVVTFDPADTTATVYVKDSSGNTVAALISTSQPLYLGGGAANPVDLSTLRIDASANSKGPFVGYEVM